MCPCCTEADGRGEAHATAPHRRIERAAASLIASSGEGTKALIGDAMDFLVGHSAASARRCGQVKRYLVVANQTLGGDHLIQAVRERMLQEHSEFWVLVPATRPADFVERYGAAHPGGMTVNTYQSESNSESGVHSGTSVAQQRLDMELQRLHEVGAEADGEVGDPDPLKAISNALAGKQFDEIILSTLPKARSRWLRQDLPGQVKKKFRLPITHIVSG